jgi:hypothetical protein
VVNVPGLGPAPKENKRRRNADTYADVKAIVTEDDVVRGPEMPGKEQYLPQVLDWYETWRRSPQAATFTNTDWQRLHMLAPLVHSYWQRPHHLVMAEIRQSESLLGATYTDRLRARMKVEKGDDKPAGTKANLTVIDSYKKRLTG